MSPFIWSFYIVCQIF